MDEPGTREACTDCGMKAGDGEGVHLLLSETVDRFFCARCAKAALARRSWKSDFEYPEFAPLTMAQGDGRLHRFEFTTHRTETGLEIQMWEADKRGAGYELEILGDFDADPLELFRSLNARMQRALCRRHLEVRDGSLAIRPEGVVRALIDRDDESDEDLPVVVIDGRPVTWEAFGRMLLRYEGWQFKLEIYDLSEEIGDDSLDRPRFLMSRAENRRLN